MKNATKSTGQNLTWSGEKYKDKKGFFVLVCTKRGKRRRMVFLFGKDGAILSGNMKKKHTISTLQPPSLRRRIIKQKSEE